MQLAQFKVAEFHKAASQVDLDRPGIPDLNIRILRAKLMLEELLETIHDGLGLSIQIDSMVNQFRETGRIEVSKIEFLEVHPGNIVETADGIADLLYVTLGTANATGINIKPIFDEVHRSNMSKFIDGQIGEDGKWKKGPSFRPPDIAPLIENNGPPIKGLKIGEFNGAIRSIKTTEGEVRVGAGESCGQRCIMVDMRHDSGNHHSFTISIDGAAYLSGLLSAALADAVVQSSSEEK